MSAQPSIKRKKISEYISTIGRVAQTSHYEVNFSGFDPSSSKLTEYLIEKGVKKDFILNQAGLLCASASLPGSSIATANLDGSFMGVQEKMAHSRIYTNIDMEFYVDREYQMIRFIDCWMDYITDRGGRKDDDGKTPMNKNEIGYYHRLSYPRTSDSKEGYKADTITITKFEPDMGPMIRYTFFGMFPINMTSIPVQYGNSDSLKMNVSFSYDRYYKEFFTENSDGTATLQKGEKENKTSESKLKPKNLGGYDEESYRERYTY